jgi:hypothetical protein
MKVWLSVLILLLGCSGEDKGRPTWLRGDTDARFATVEKHLRGFDATMVEVGYRYVELYWAGRDANWSYADYQIDTEGPGRSLERRSGP